jgi:hypothetical protein
MKMRAVIALTRRNQRALSRRLEPRGLRFRVFLLRQVARTLDAREGHRLSHGTSALAALLLTGLGVTGAGPLPGDRHGLAGHAAAGVLDRLHPPSSHRGPRAHAPARRSLGGVG